MEELKRLENDMKASEELRKNLDEAVRRIAAEGQAQNDGEAMVLAAKELGYDISIAALEQAKAAAEDLDAEDLEKVSAGHSDMCEKDYFCVMNYHTDDEDNEGHDIWCLAAWHCMGAALHTEGGTKDEACWSSYKCVLAFH